MRTKSNTPVIIAGYIGMAFFGVAFVVMGAVLPSLITKFSMNTAVASTLAGLLPLGVMLGSLFFGPIIDRFGYKNLLIISSLICIIGLEMLAFCSQIGQIRVAIFLIGLGGGLINGETNALVSDSSSDNNRASNLSILGVFYCVGAICIPLLFAWLSKTYTYTPIVSGAGAVMFLSIIYYLFITFPQAKVKQGFPFKKMIKMAKEPVLLVLSFTLFFQSGLEGIINTWISSYLESERGIGSGTALMALTFIIIGVGSGRLLLSILLKFISREKVLITSMMIAALGILIITYIKIDSFTIFGTFLMGLGFASSFPIVFSEIGERYKDLSGTAFSFALTIALTGNILINLLIGITKLEAFPILIIGCVIFIIILYSINYRIKQKQLC